MFLLLNKDFIQSYYLKKHKLSFLLLITIFVLMSKEKYFSKRFKSYIEHYKILFDNNKDNFYNDDKDNESGIESVKFVYENETGSIVLSNSNTVSFEYVGSENLLNKLINKLSSDRNVKKLSSIIDEIKNEKLKYLLNKVLLQIQNQELDTKNIL
mgnify:CR=1 FL=1